MSHHYRGLCYADERSRYQPRLKFAKGDEHFRPSGGMCPELGRHVTAILTGPPRQTIPYDKIYIGQGRSYWGHKKPALPTPLPGILGVSKQVSSPA